ncbi:MAG: aminoglycoside phosphotransferase family protein [Deltaproteobacteria bacterium]|nr:aminoglycoside phosphotransferase family protein [Deltaproteobacteria bacterium]
MGNASKNGRYLGHLQREDPLYEYLQSQIAPQLGLHIPDACYRVFRFTDSQNVYLYEEKGGTVRWVAKFFKSWDPQHACRKGETEFNNLTFLRRLGFCNRPHYVVRPFGFNPSIDNVLVVEYLEGDSVSAVIDDAIHCGMVDRLFRKLKALACFLAVFHCRTAGEWSVDFRESLYYTARVLRSLEERWGLDRQCSDRLWSLGERWLQRSFMWEEPSVLVHGDATPSNFLFGKGMDVMAIDLERMQWADPVFDVGRLCGELKHVFLRCTGNPSAAEPYIGHFLREYCGHLEDREQAFSRITRRLPFYMGITLLRIARNSWITPDYRRSLVEEAINTLEARV